MPKKSVVSLPETRRYLEEPGRKLQDLGLTTPKKR